MRSYGTWLTLIAAAAFASCRTIDDGCADCVEEVADESSGGAGNPSSGASGRRTAGSSGTLPVAHEGGEAGTPPQGGGGTSPAGAEGESAGGSGRPSNAAGSGGDSGSDDLGLAGGGCCIVDVVLPVCILDEIRRAPARDISITDRGDGLGHGAYATHAVDNTVVHGGRESGGVDANWGPWLCFDSVPRPDRIASATPQWTLLAETYVTTLDGRLFFREVNPILGDWLPWMELPTPRAHARLVDVEVAGVPSPVISVYLSSDGDLFVRSRLEPTGDAAFGPWKSIGGVTAKRVAVEELSDGKHRLLVVTDDGELFSAQGRPYDAEGFEPWTTLTTPQRLAGIDVGHGADGATLLFILDDQGGLLSSLDGSHWVERVASPEHSKIVDIAAGTLSGEDPSVLGVDEFGNVFVAVPPWQGWTLLQ